MVNKIGRAYAFFDCNASYAQIQTELPNLREVARTPSNLELSLHEGFKQLRGKDPQLNQVIAEAEEAGLKYAFIASLAGATNKTVAKETGDILIAAYASPLFAKGENLGRAVVCKVGREYLFRD